MSESTALSALLAAEHAAVYAYGVLGARLDERTRTVALAAFDAHRTRRDDLIARLRTLAIPTTGPATSYDVVVAGRVQALALAIRVETGLGVLWRDLVASTDDRSLRRIAVQALQDSAVRATGWRKLSGVTPVTEALPGEV